MASTGCSSEIPYFVIIYESVAHLPALLHGNPSMALTGFLPHLNLAACFGPAYLGSPVVGLD